MDALTKRYLEQLAAHHELPLYAYEHLVRHADAEGGAYAASLARAAARRVFGTAIFARGLIEVSNYCKNDCLYCGIRKSNTACARYRLREDAILQCAKQGYEQGFRTFVLQGGEDPLLTDEKACRIVRVLKGAHPDCAVTLSLGQRSRASYASLRAAGASRYLLRHETATPQHYAQLHPASMSFDERMACLRVLRAEGFAVGCGFMVGSPFQTPAHLAADLKFTERFEPEMCGIGPFIPHAQTPFAHAGAGQVSLTCFMLSLVRLMHPGVLLPATTALGALAPDGIEQGIAAGANVIMLNLTPQRERAKYTLYNNKARSSSDAVTGFAQTDARLRSIGYHLVIDRGDPPQ